MIKGKAELKLSKATILAALQSYLDSQMSGMVKVTDVQVENLSGQNFIVSVEEVPCSDD